MRDIANRLKQAREAAGYTSAQEAALRFGWVYGTYAGHENGHRGIKTDTLKIYSRAFKVEMTWLLTGQGSGTAQPRQAANGMEETEILPFRGKSADHQQTLTALARAISPGSQHQQLLVANRDYHAYAIVRGDILVIAQPKTPAIGGVVAVNMADTTTGATNTVLRQAQDGVLVAPLGYLLPDESRLSQGIMGHVVAVIRAPQLET